MFLFSMTSINILFKKYCWLWTVSLLQNHVSTCKP